MPWVFTHAIKDYYDMPYIAIKNKAKVTFNLVPSLIVQLREYSNFEVNDRFLKYIKKKQRSEYENEFILSIIKSTPSSFIDKMPRFKELLNSPHLNIDSMNDLEMFFLLSHCGEYLRKNSELVRGLLHKTSFIWEEKLSLLSELHVFVSKILPFYKEAFLSGALELTTTPFYHPIIPLLLNLNSAETLKKPSIFADFKDDAKKQMEMAITLFEEEFEKKPSGIWPSEGSVSSEALELFNEFGFKWVATDEDILHKTDPSLSLDKKYTYKGINLVFRNKKISDSIGFRYRFLKTDEAIGDFKGMLESVNIIIMDGENAWEYYSNPKEFLDAFYKEINKYDVLTVGEFVENAGLETVELKSIASGSWIGANFAIWIGDDEKNRAWELLSLAKKALDENPNEEARKLLLIDEGSDWFWWYGQTNYTKHKKLYDYLFKSRIAEIYRLLNKPLDDIFSFIIAEEDNNKPPVSYLRATIDGRERFFEYVNAGCVEVRGSTMHTNPIIKKIKYGYDDEKNLYLAIFLTKLKDVVLRLNNETYVVKKGVYRNYAVDKIVEIKMPLCDKIKIEVLEDGKSLQELSFDIKPISFTWIA